ncbi:hypothetical protein [Hymenobacter lapidarius]|nr:hypothetical protein [Hymenobacter lapidarius]
MKQLLLLLLATFLPLLTFAQLTTSAFEGQIGGRDAPAFPAPRWC